MAEIHAAIAAPALTDLTSIRTCRCPRVSRCWPNPIRFASTSSGLGRWMPALALPAPEAAPQHRKGVLRRGAPKSAKGRFAPQFLIGKGELGFEGRASAGPGIGGEGLPACTYPAV